MESCVTPGETLSRYCWTMGRFNRFTARLDVTQECLVRGSRLMESCLTHGGSSRIDLQINLPSINR